MQQFFEDSRIILCTKDHSLSTSVHLASKTTGLFKIISTSSDFANQSLQPDLSRCGPCPKGTNPGQDQTPQRHRRLLSTW